MRLPFALAFYQHRSLPVSAQRLINLFVEKQPPDAKATTALLPTPGLREFADLTAGPIRGLCVMGQYLYVVAGVTVYRVDADGNETSLGTIAGGGPVSMDQDGNYLCIVVPDTFGAWAVDRATETLTKISDPDFLGATSVCVIDGYFIFSKPNSTEFFLSALNDPTTFDALDFASAEGSPDNIVAASRVGRDLWLFGETSAEVWSNVGATDFPFLRVSGGFIQRGTSARFSITSRLGTAVWLGDDRVVYTAAGVQPQRISTHALEQAIGGYERVDDAVGYIYEQEGHVFYVLSFPSAGDTWVYDFASGAWHERESEGLGVWRAALGVAFAGAVIAGDNATAKLWRVDPTYAYEDDAQIIRVATGTAFHAEGKKVFFSRLTAEFETGVGLVTGQGSSPVAWLAWSDDGGRTWGNAAEASLGAIGQYRTRVEWRRLGSARHRVFRLQWSDPVYTTLIAADVEAESGE